MTVIVLFGGSSDERQVSVATGQNVARTLDGPICWFWAPNGAVHDVRIGDLFDHERPFEVDVKPRRPARWPTFGAALDALTIDDPVFFLALHGGPGEDGTVQRLLEQRHTSAGRVPTESGLRFFIQSLLKVRGLNPREKDEIRQRLMGGARIDVNAATAVRGLYAAGEASGGATTTGLPAAGSRRAITPSSTVTPW